MMLMTSVVLLSGCSALIGEEVGRLSVEKPAVDDNQLNEVSTTIDLTKGESVAIWTDMDLEYEGNVRYVFRSSLITPSQDTLFTEIDPEDRSITIGEMSTTWMGETSTSYEGKAFDYTAEEDGTHTITAYFVVSDAERIAVNKADLVLRK